MKLEESEEKSLYSSTNDEDINQSIIRNDCLVILLVVTAQEGLDIALICAQH